MPEELLRFWFEEIEPKQWWVADAEFDALVRSRFLGRLQQAMAGELSPWRATPHGRLAEIIVLDQLSRNIFRGQREAFAQDAQALALAQEAVARGALDALSEIERGFLLMPFMHSESRLIHAQADALFQQFASPQSHAFELRHKAIVDRFGRYPHRNAILGRISSAEELAFLQEPGSSF